MNRPMCAGTGKEVVTRGVALNTVFGVYCAKCGNNVEVEEKDAKFYLKAHDWMGGDI